MNPGAKNTQAEKSCFVSRGNLAVLNSLLICILLSLLFDRYWELKKNERKEARILSTSPHPPRLVYGEISQKIVSENEQCASEPQLSVILRENVWVQCTFLVSTRTQYYSLFHFDMKLNDRRQITTIFFFTLTRELYSMCVRACVCVLVFFVS